MGAAERNNLSPARGI